LFKKIISIDEANLRLSGHVNRHNCVYWDTENPHIMFDTQLNQSGVSVWGGISSFRILGLCSFKGRMTGDSYLDMLQNYTVPELRMHWDNLNNILFQEDGAPPHYAIMCTRT
jgi:hypothetical protein